MITNANWQRFVTRSEAGYVDGQNVNIEYRRADNRTDRLPEMMAELVNKKAFVIVATSTPAALAAKAAGTKASADVSAISMRCGVSLIQSSIAGGESGDA